MMGYAPKESRAFLFFLFKPKHVRSLIICNGSFSDICHLHSMNFGQFYGTFYVEVCNFSGPKLEGKNATA